MAQELAAFTLGPVLPSAFAGRREEAEEVLIRACLPSPPLQSLEGPSKIGRTSMLHYLRAISRSEIRHPALKGREGHLIAPHIDLTLRHQLNGRAEKVIYDAIVEEIRAHKLPAPDLPEGAAASAVIAARMEELTKDGHTFLLLADRVEHLLTTDRFDDRERQMWSDTAVAALGELNERVQIAVLLAFGATGPAKEVRPRARRLKMIEALNALSHMLTRGNAARTGLGLLNEAEVRGFVEKVGRPEGTGRERKLVPAEVDWLVDLAGGHPLVMQNAGLRLLETGSADEAEQRRHEVESELADPGLQGFLIDTFLRIDPIDRGSLIALGDLGAGDPVELEPELTEILEEEGLILRVGESDAVTMPSRALRAALLAYLAARRAADAGRSRPALGLWPQPRSPRASLALAGSDEGPALRLTRSEHSLVRELLAADDDDIASRAALKAALGSNTDDAQLTQRVSVLRTKIRESLGIEDAIVSVYGEGYRLNEARRYELREA